MDTSTFTLACSLWLLWWNHPNWNTISSALQCCSNSTWSVPHLARKFPSCDSSPLPNICKGMTFTNIWWHLMDWRQFPKEHIWASEMSPLSTVSYDQLKASQGWPEGLSLLPRPPNCVGISETIREPGLGCPGLHERLVEWKTKNIKQNKNITFNWSFPKKLSINRLTMPYFYWAFGNIWC